MRRKTRLQSTNSTDSKRPKPKPNPRTIRSRRVENIAAEFLARSGWRILHQNLEVAQVQIDLLARDPRGVLTVVEVKTSSSLVRLSHRQKSRLLRAGQVLAGHEPVQLVFAQVSGADVLVLPVDGLTA